MNKIQIASVMSHGAEEIRRLRATNQSQGERLELVYAMLRMSGAVQPTPPMGMSECIGARLEKHAEELTLEAKATSVTANGTPASELLERYQKALEQAFATELPASRVAFLDMAMKYKQELRELIRGMR